MLNNKFPVKLPVPSCQHAELIGTLKVDTIEYLTFQIMKKQIFDHFKFLDQNIHAISFYM